MQCPHCGNEVRIPQNTLVKVDTHGERSVSITDCCGKLVGVTPVRSYSVEKLSDYETATRKRFSGGADDWGRTPKGE